MSRKEALRRARAAIASESIPDAEIEAELLLARSLGVGKAELYATLDQPLSSTEVERLWSLVERRLTHEPAAYILRESGFFDLDLYVDSRALIPRPESELLVEMALEFIHRRFSSNEPCCLADVGTGSGAIAVALAVHLPQARVYAMDVSEAALEVAGINCQRHGVQGRVSLVLGDMLQPLPEPVHVIVANLPYVRDCDMPHLAPEIRGFEPAVALVGGADGLEEVGRLLSQAGEKLLDGGLVLVEVGQGQGAAAAALARGNFPTAEVDLVPDLAGIDRVVRVLT